MAAILVAAVAQADSPLGLTISILGTEGGVLHFPADTSTPFYLDGFISDPTGAPLEGISISDGTQTTRSLPDGTWSLPEPAAGQYVVTVKSDRTDTAAYRLTAPGVPGVYGAATTLRYNIGLASWSVSGSEASVAIVTTAPPGGSCVFIIDTATGTATPATYSGPTDAGGASLWSATISSSIQRVRVVGFHCTTLVPVTDTRSVSYPLDRVIGAPSGMTYWFNTANPVIAFAVGDPGGSGVDPESISVVAEGVALAVGFDGAGSYQAQARGLGDGLHAASVRLADFAGNSATIPLSLAVDTAAPIAEDLSPAEGDVTGVAPTLSLSVTDGNGSGINPTASRFVLTNGLVASTLRPSLSAGVLSYQVPSSGIGPNLGQGPLPPGLYTVDAFVQDLAGNQTHLSALFTVLPF